MLLGALFVVVWCDCQCHFTVVLILFLRMSCYQCTWCLYWSMVYQWLRWSFCGSSKFSLSVEHCGIFGWDIMALINLVFTSSFEWGAHVIVFFESGPCDLLVVPMQVWWQFRHSISHLHQTLPVICLELLSCDSHQQYCLYTSYLSIILATCIQPNALFNNLIIKSMYTDYIHVSFSLLKQQQQHSCFVWF